MIDFGIFVEAHLNGITIEEASKTINLSFRSQEKQRFTLVAEEVDRFVAREFCEQNIVDLAQLWNTTSCPDQYREALAALLSGDNEHWQTDAWAPLIEAEIALIQAGEKVFFSIEAVYGASVVILAKKVFVLSS